MFNVRSKNIARFLKEDINSLLKNPNKASDLSWATWIYQVLPKWDSNGGSDIEEMAYAESSLVLN